VSHETYNPKIKTLLEQVRAEALERGFLCDEPCEMTDEEYKFCLLVQPAGTPSDAEIGVDVSITTLESECNDGEENGLNFSLDVTGWGGTIIGGMTPFNYSSRVWVQRDDAEAVQERWELFQGAFDPSVVIDSIEEHYAR